MATPLSNTRRIEELERRLAEQTSIGRSVLGRPARAQGKRWTYLAKTVLDEEEDYPTSGNTFPFKFFDRSFTATAGAQVASDTMRSAEAKTVGRTINGQFLIPDSIVLAEFLPPPPSTTGKGQWGLLPLQTYYYGKLNGSLVEDVGSVPSSASVSILRLVGGAWTDTGYDVTAINFFLRSGAIAANTRVRIDWHETVWVFNTAACEPEP